MIFCSVIWPLRDNSQLMKTLAALGWGARLTKPSVPNCVTKPRAFFEHARPECIHRQPLRLETSASQKKQIAALPTASQSVPWR